MKAGKYCIRDLFVNRYVQQIIIPEIQRDYVWEPTQVNGLLTSILKDYNKYCEAKVPSISTDDIDDIDIDDIRAFETFYKKRKYTANIGFIYAYNDEAYAGKYFLIDGQQRITTIYLLLAVLANRNDALREEFKKNYLIDQNPKLAYKVRTSANELLDKFIQHIVNKDTDVNDEIWMIDAYKKDLTGKCIINNYNAINSFLSNEKNISEKDLFNYIETLTEFWYFDTNVSEQGEELYIYMNARGEHMQSNENIKADFLSKLDSLDEKNEYGAKWEEWQDFFWKHRGNNTTADKGFNQFLSCIAGLEYYLEDDKDDKSKFYVKEKFEGKNHNNTPDGIDISDILEVLDIQKIEQYYKVFHLFVSSLKDFDEKEGYSTWISEVHNDFWNVLNNNTVNWFADYNDRNRNTERNNMVFIWSIFHYIKKSLNPSEDTYKTDIVRFVRRIYLRFKNNNRSVSTIKKHVEITLINGVIDISNKSTGVSENAIEGEQDVTVLNSEELLKNNLILNTEEVNRKTVEQLIWQIEDHPLNIDGRDVGNTNFTHLISREINNVDIPYLTSIHKKFYEIFPVPDYPEVKIIEILLYYGAFYDRVSPGYYTNLKFNNWRRIIRNLGTEINESKKEPFTIFFNEFLTYDGTLKNFLDSKRDIENIDVTETTTIHSKLLWYSKELKEKMWDRGFSIAIKHDQLINTKGNFKGGNPILLKELLNQ